jgi:hypothetical protein
MGTTEKNIYNLLQTRFYYESIHPIVGNENSFKWKPLMSKLNKVCGMAYWMSAEVHSGSYANIKYKNDGNESR